MIAYNHNKPCIELGFATKWRVVEFAAYFSPSSWSRKPAPAMMKRTSSPPDQLEDLKVRNSGELTCQG